MVFVIETRRLHLIPGSARIARADLESREALAHALGVQVPADWPPEYFDSDALNYTLGILDAKPEHSAWWLYYFVRKATHLDPAVVVGAGGFRGPPADGTVEVGYSIVPQFRRQGFASEAVQGFVAFAFANADVRRVRAQTLAGLAPSIGVLQKCGFRFAGPGSDAPDALCFERPRALDS